MFCMNCGKTLPDGAKFCKFCGTPQDAVAPTAPSNSESINLDGSHTFVPAMCPNCNAHMKVDSSSKIARCDNCGTECLVQDAIKALNVRGNVQVGNATINVNGTNTESLLKRTEIMLADGDFLGAREKCDIILDSDPTNAKAYIAMLMAVLNVRRQDDLANCRQPFDNNNYYLKAMQFGDEKTKAKLSGYIEQINKRKVIEYYTEIYNQALWLMKTASTEADYSHAIGVFKSIPVFKDSNEKINECIRRIEEIKAAAIERKEREAEKSRIAEEKAGRLNKFLIIALLILVIIVLIPLVIIPALKLNKAKRLMKNGDYDSAYALLTELGKTDEITANKYDRAITLLNSGDYEAGYVLLEEIGKTDEFQPYKHDRAIALLNSGDYETAYALLKELGEGYEIKESKYNRAIAFISSGDYEEAYLLLEEIDKFKDSSYQLEKIKPMYYKILLSKAEVGDTVHFGLYEQDNNTYNGKEYIEWIVLAKDGDDILVTSKYALDYVSYHNKDEDVTWSQCYLRSWLNEDFYNEAFNLEYQKHILDTTVKPDDSSSLEEDTIDKVFLLSQTDASKYFDYDPSRNCRATTYAYSKINDLSEYYCFWYLRTPGDDSRSVAVVTNKGTFEFDYKAFDNDNPCAVRPAMWISTAD